MFLRERPCRMTRTALKKGDTLQWQWQDNIYSVFPLLEDLGRGWDVN